MRKLITLLTIGLALTSCQKDYYLDDLNEAQAEIARLENNISSLQSALTTAQAEETRLEALLYTATQDLEQSRQAQINLGNINGELNATIASLNAQIADLMAQLSGMRSELSEAQADLTAAQQNNQANVDALNSRIASLQAEISSIEPEIVTVIEYVDRIVYVTQTETPAPRPQMGNEEGVNNSYISVGTQAFYTSPDSPILLPEGQRFLFVTISVLGDTLAYVDSDTQPSNGAIPFAAGTYTIAFYDGDFSKAITFTIQ